MRIMAENKTGVFYYNLGSEAMKTLYQNGRNVLKFDMSEKRFAIGDFVLE